MSPRLATHKAPFPYFGGKAAIAPAVWDRLGDVGRYIEPFAGSLAVLLCRPVPFAGREIVNDSDGLLVNVWRAMKLAPEAVAAHADWPATESDLHARHAWLVGHREDITRHLEGDPDWCDPKAAGWWLWGISLWIGSGWCSGTGPWRVIEEDAGDGQGVTRQLLYAGDGRGVTRKLLDTDAKGTAVLGPLGEMFAELSGRLERTVVMCGDWSRVVSRAVLFGGASSKPVGVFLDPPYDAPDTARGIYAHEAGSPAAAAREWALANGDNPRLRIAFCGYEGEHDDWPESWTELAWTQTAGSYSTRGERKGKNVRRERVWFSPHCLRPGLWEATA